jgi:hypothetical protein
MTMPNASHPDDERLAAYADADRDVVDDRSLREHLAGCSRCSDLVADLTSLRSMLAELPDIAPSRPLRLLPPAPVVTPSRGGMPWLRRLVAPTIAAGIGLALVGAVGTAGLLGGSGAAFLSREAAGASPRDSFTGQQPAAYDSNTDSIGRDTPSAAYGGATSPVPASSSPVPSASHAPATAGGGGGGGQKSTTPETTPTMLSAATWLVVLAVGLALILVGLVLRFSVQARAG